MRGALGAPQYGRKVAGCLLGLLFAQFKAKGKDLGSLVWDSALGCSVNM